MTARSRTFLALAVFVSASFPALVCADDNPEGARLYKSKCASCHGPKGEGTKRYKKTLEGDLSVAQLADLIQKTMPESAPGTLSQNEARAISEHVHGAFYSRIARERARPPRVELSRLTVRQYRNATADLIGAFRWQPRWPAERGLKGEYFKNRNFAQNNRVLERLDPQVAFDFGTDSAVPEKTEPHEFCIRWSGSLLAPETGEYQIIARTEHAVRVFVNDSRKPLIDAWVKSGNDTEYRGTIFLLAGRIYPVRVEYSKAKQGVNDSDKNKGKKLPLVRSSMTLLWQRPHQVPSPIAARHLAPTPSPEVYTCATPFPPDDRSYGWERGTTISKEWDQATTAAALETATYIASRINELAGTRDGASDRQAKLQKFVHAFAERAFRRPLSTDQKAVLDRQLKNARDEETAIKRAVALVLKSPRFLYRELAGTGDGYDVAARLSFSLWNALPDRTLLDLAAAGKLTSADEVRRQAERMLADPRAKARLREFLLTWVKADLHHDLAKDPKKFPGFDEPLIADLRTSLELFLDEIIDAEKPDFRRLFTEEQVYLSNRLAKFYGVEQTIPPGAFVKLRLDNGKRAGILSHPYLMASFSSSAESSPIHRGVFLARGALGVPVRTPPAAVAPAAPDLFPGMTTRERTIQQTKPTVCMTCHTVINPLGFSLEHFDAVGRYREKDNGKPVDASSSYQPREGKPVQLTGARELASYLAQSPDAHDAFTEQMFHFLVQQSVRAYGTTAQDELRRAFVNHDFDLRKLAVEILVRSALVPRSTATASPRRGS
ncbi:MAG: DUF1592 domain-containing protein [Gemmataceae bacterium]